MPPRGKRNLRSSVTVVTLLQVALPGLAVLALIGTLGVLVLRDRGEKESVRDARQLTRAIGVGMIQPRLRDSLLDQDRQAIARLDDYVKANVLPLDHGIVRVKVWKTDGTIVYSDESRLIGARYALDEEERDALRAPRQVVAELSDLRSPENRFETRNDQLLEVYLPLRMSQGTVVLFETYWRYSAVTADARDIWLRFTPALLAGLALLWLMQLPLAWRFARRLKRSQNERELLLVQAMEASDAERRRIAADLHDGVVQDLAGLSLVLSATAERENGTDLGDRLGDAAQMTRANIRQMRSLLVDIYPATLHSSGLPAALDDLLAPLAARGLRTEADVDRGLAPSPEVEQLVFRTAQEALRNVLAHASAASVELRARAANGTVALEIADDGVGFAPETAQHARAAGHFGLQILGDRAAELGGRLVVRSAPGGGTRVRLEVPAR